MTRANTAHYVERANCALPGGRLTAFPISDEMMLVASRGRGSRLYNVDGRDYLDLTCGGGPLILGHSHPAVVDAVRTQAEAGSAFVGLHDRGIELAEKLVQAIPCADAVGFASTGAEATYFALRLARAHTGKKKILKFEGAYHGHHDYALINMTPAESNTPLVPRADSGGIPDEILNLVIIAPFNDIAATRALIEAHAHELAAVIVEPVQRSTTPAAGFLECIRETTARCGVLLIFDEVVTGFRLAYGGAQEYFGVTPDLATYGKALSGGYPLSAIAGRSEIMDLAGPSRCGSKEHVYTSGTLSGNPLCCAASLATLRQLSQPGVYDRLNRLGDMFRQGLERILTDHGIPARVTGIGSLFQVSFTAHPMTNYHGQFRTDRTAFELFTRQMFDKGVYMSRGTKCYLSTAHTEADLEEFLSTAKAVCAEGFALAS